MTKVFWFISLCLLSSYVNATSWSGADIERAKRFSTQLLGEPKDASNKYLNNQQAIAFGEQLFKDKRLSSNGLVACNSCHIKEHNFTDTKKLAVGIREGFRNTPTLVNVSHHDWFFADGAKDSLWAQVLSSIENPAEQNFTRTQVLHLISKDKNYRDQYVQIFSDTLPNNQQQSFYPAIAGPNANIQDLKKWKKLSKEQRKRINQVFSNIGKSLAAYVSTIKAESTRFDSFLKDLSTKKNSNNLTESEQRGFRLFMSEQSGCSSCHNGPFFSNKSFHHIATGIPGSDNGRSEVLESVIRDEFNCLSEYSNAKPEACLELNYVNRDKHHLRGTFKTPTLRGLKKTAPYMHDGRFESLEKVIEHYETISRMPQGTTDLSSVTLNNKEKKDLINFLLIL